MSGSDGRLPSRCRHTWTICRRRRSAGERARTFDFAAILGIFFVINLDRRLNQSSNQCQPPFILVDGPQWAPGFEATEIRVVVGITHLQQIGPTAEK